MPTSPFTSNATVVIERRISAEALRRRWQQEVGVEVEPELSGVEEILICRCPASQLRFVWPSTIAGRGEFYAKLQRHPWYYAPERWEFSEAIRALATNWRVIEVGSGSGHFLSQAAAMGLAVRGIELNVSAVAAARAKGLDCEHRDLAELSAANPGTYDALCSFQVLEHVANPREFLENCVALVRPGGRLIFAVPDSCGWMRHHDFLLDLPPHHMLGWSAASFQAVARLLGLEVERVAYEPLPAGQIENYLTARRASFPAPMRRLFFNRFTLPVAASFLRSSMHSVRGQSMLAVLRRPSVP